MRRALVTGGAGFVGRHMMKGLADQGWDVVGVDIRDRPYVSGVLVTADARRVFAGHIAQHERFDLIVHCAYHVGGRAAIDGEPRLLAWNLELDAQLFDWAVRTQQGRVLYYSSSAAYPVELQSAESWTGLVEDHIDLRNARQPDARYGWAKLTGERMAEAARLSGLDVTVLRPFSGYGGDQDLTYPFPAILNRVRRGDLSVWGPPGQRRDWIHIDDVVGCSIAAVEQGIAGPVNVCSGVGVEMGDLAVLMARVAGTQVRQDPTYLVDQPTGVMVRIGDPNGMRQFYQPRVELEEGIRRALGENE
jgi:nucleoside-diphosphate-sugar epimerase